jgi:hypothetical protein
MAQSPAGNFVKWGGTYLSWPRNNFLKLKLVIQDIEVTPFSIVQNI